MCVKYGKYLLGKVEDMEAGYSEAMASQELQRKIGIRRHYLSQKAQTRWDHTVNLCQKKTKHEATLLELTQKKIIFMFLSLCDFLLRAIR